MADVKWIKIVTDIFDDEKILLIESMPDADSIIVIWFKLLCLAGKQNNSGVFMLGGHIPYTDEMFATIFRRPINTVRLALQTFEKFGMVEVINDCVTIPNWSKHQTLDKIEQKNAYMRDYMKDYRDKQKALTDCKTNSKTNSKANVSSADKNKKEIRKELEEREKRFAPPSIEEVRAYCLERRNGVDPQTFVDFYASKGWKVGREPMKDWRAAVRTWEKREDRPGKTVSAQRYEQRTYTEEDLAGDDIIIKMLEAKNA